MTVGMKGDVDKMVLIKINEYHVASIDWNTSCGCLVRRCLPPSVSTTYELSRLTKSPTPDRGLLKCHHQLPVFIFHAVMTHSHSTMIWPNTSLKISRCSRFMPHTNTAQLAVPPSM